MGIYSIMISMSTYHCVPDPEPSQKDCQIDRKFLLEMIFFRHFLKKKAIHRVVFRFHAKDILLIFSPAPVIAPIVTRWN